MRGQGWLCGVQAFPRLAGCKLAHSPTNSLLLPHPSATQMSQKHPLVDVFTEDDIARLCSAFAPELSCRTREDATDRKYAFTLGAKTVEFIWPRQAPEEIWVALFSSPEDFRAGTADLVMCEEPMSRAGCDWMVGFMQRLGWRYLRSHTRISHRNSADGGKRLECFDGEQWKDIYQDFD